jgi:hypothetical protein
MAFCRFGFSFRKFGVVMLGLGMLAGSARATITYQATQGPGAGSFTTKAGTDSLTVSSLITFTGALCTTGCANGVIGDEYVDPTTGIEFLAFMSDGLTNVAFASITAGTLNTVAGSGDYIEVIFPAGLHDGFAFNFTTAYSNGINLCVDTSVPGPCASGGTYVGQNVSGFVGAVNDNPTPAPLVSLWLYPTSGFAVSAGTDIQSFEVANPATTPEGPTLLLIGPGLIGLLFYRRRHQRQVKPRS